MLCLPLCPLRSLLLEVARSRSPASTTMSKRVNTPNKRWSKRVVLFYQPENYFQKTLIISRAQYLGENQQLHHVGQQNPS